MARRLGATEAELAALEKGELNVFSVSERAALVFAQKLTLDSNNVTNQEFAVLQEYFTEGEIVEIAAVAGAFNYFNRFNNALKVEPTR